MLEFLSPGYSFCETILEIVVNHAFTNTYRFYCPKQLKLISSIPVSIITRIDIDNGPVTVSITQDPVIHCVSFHCLGKQRLAFSTKLVVIERSEYCSYSYFVCTVTISLMTSTLLDEADKKQKSRKRKKV